MTISMGAFAMVNAQFDAYNEQGGKEPSEFYCNCRNLSLTVGAIATFSAEATWQLAMIGYLSLGLSASLAMGLTIGGAWYNFDPVNSNFGSVQWAGTSGLTVMLKIMVSVTLGIGVKGLVSAAITGFGYISILISGPGPRARPRGSGSRWARE